MTEEKIIDKVMKLLAKAESTTPEEAEALSAKAEQLLAQHSIDMAIVEARRKGQGKPEAIITKWIEVGGIYWQAHRDIGYKIGTAFGFKLIERNWSGKAGIKGAFAWVGFESDIEKAEILYTSLLIQCMKALRPFAKDWKDQYGYLGSMEGFKARRSFILGFAATVGHRLSERFRAAAKETEAAQAAACPDGDTGTGVALVLANRRDRVNEFYDVQYGRLKAGRSRGLSGGVGGYAAGGDAGRRANLGGPAVGGSKGALNS